IAIFTNIEFDHPDVYSSIDELRDAFRDFSKHVEKTGILIANGDDPQIEKLLKEYNGRVIRFGYSGRNDFRIKKIDISFEQTFFWIDAYNTSLGEFALKVVGEHNVLNATAAIIASLEIGLDVSHIKKALTRFTGSKRRFEYIGKSQSGALLFDDYAHHPTEIKKTLKAFTQTYPSQKIVCIFQPHTYSRTKALFSEFVHSFYDCKELILIPVYPSLREKEDRTVSSENLASSIKRFQRNVQFLPTALSVVQYLEQKAYKDDTIIITMGAGDVYKLWKNLL
ncbi:MAG: cyanophycin synthetase, partial [bacterium]|nr:cyanophycin synthetase [bacterium]